MTDNLYRQLEYRRAGVETASAIELVIMLYDTLNADIGRASSAIAICDFERCSSELKHAMLVLDQLDGCVDQEHGGELATSLEQFHSVIRAKLLEAQIKKEPKLLGRQIELIREVRQAWETVGTRDTVATPSVSGMAASQAPDESTATSCWSA